MNREQIAARVVQAFENCTHPFASRRFTFGQWCNVCGAIRFGGDGDPWDKPHWRDLILRALEGEQ